MSNDKATELEARVRRLEKQNRIMVMAGLFVASLIGVIGFARSDDEIVGTLKARALVLYTSDNKVLVKAGFSQWAEGAAIQIYDENGERRSWWTASPGGATFFLDGNDPGEDELDSFENSIILNSNRASSSINLWGTGGFASLSSESYGEPMLRIWRDDSDNEPVFTTDTGKMIFDGKTLDGWTAIGGGKWEVKDGVIAGTSSPDQPQGVLMWKDPVKNFTAKLKFRIRAGDSGFYFRTERVDQEVIVHGFQVEVDTSRETGGIYETGGRGWVHFPDFKLHDQSKYKAGEWTDLEVTAIGTHYLIKVNGVVITDIDDPKGRTEGRLALQLHGGLEMDIEYKDIYLKALK